MYPLIYSCLFTFIHLDLRILICGQPLKFLEPVTHKPKQVSRVMTFDDLTAYSTPLFLDLKLFNFKLNLTGCL